MTKLGKSTSSSKQATSKAANKAASTANNFEAMMSQIAGKEWNSERRFGKIPRGIHNVTIVDAQWANASESSRLADDATFVGFEVKSKYDQRFDQKVLWIVYADDEDRVIVDMAHTTSWMKVSDLADDEQEAKAMVSRHGLQVTTGNRLVTPDGTAIPECHISLNENGEIEYSKHNSRTENTMRNLLQRFSAAGVTTPINQEKELIGKRVQIVVEYDHFTRGNEVSHVYQENYKQVATAGATAFDAPPEPSFPNAPELPGPSNDDLPF